MVVTFVCDCQLLDYVTSHGRTDEAEKIWKEKIVVYSRYCYSIGLEVQDAGQDSQCPVRHLNPGPPEYGSRALPLRQPAR